MSVAANCTSCPSPRLNRDPVVSVLTEPGTFEEVVGPARPLLPRHASEFGQVQQVRDNASAPAGGPSLLGDQGRHEWQPVGEQLDEARVHEARRSEDVGHELTLAQGVEGGDVRASRTGLQLLDAAPLVDRRG